MIILSTAAPELEFYSGRRSFLAIKIQVAGAQLGGEREGGTPALF